MIARAMKKTNAIAFSVTDGYRPTSALKNLTQPSIGLGDLPRANPQTATATTRVRRYGMRGYHILRWETSAPSGRPIRVKKTKPNSAKAAKT